MIGFSAKLTLAPNGLLGLRMEDSQSDRAADEADYIMDVQLLINSVRCISTVFTLKPSRPATCLFEWPLARRAPFQVAEHAPYPPIIFARVSRTDAIIFMPG